MLILILLSGCGSRIQNTLQPVPSPRPLTIFADSSLTEAFSELGAQFETNHPDVDVIFNFAGSKTLRTQILEGAHGDVFASASPDEMGALLSGGLVETGAPQVFATNMLVVITPANNPAHIEALEQLAQAGLKVVMASEQVPAGRYARLALMNMNSDYGKGFDQKVIANVVSNEENVRQVLAKVQLGEADAGFVYLSDTLAAPDLPAIVIPARYGGFAKYPVAVLKNSQEPGLAAEFVRTLLSGEGQVVLRRWGFGGRE